MYNLDPQKNLCKEDFFVFHVQHENGLYLLLNAMGDVVFYFLPIVLGYNLAKHLKGVPILGLAIGAILSYPAINGVDLAY